MASVSLILPRRVARWDRAMVALAIAHAALLLSFPAAPIIALGVWWNSNTISHNFLHRPFFRSRWANRLFAAYLSALLGIPQSLWRDRHLAHHAAIAPRLRRTPELGLQIILVLIVWAALAAQAPAFFFEAYLPGYLAGLGLCALHGYYEHAGGVTSHYGSLYNLLCFNDGYHSEHHAHPAAHWTALPQARDPAVRASSWPAPLRWMEMCSLEGLERLVLRSRALQNFVLRKHSTAFRGLARSLPAVREIAIVGGGIFPRTALIVSELLPAARITIVDADRANLDEARAILRRDDIRFLHARFPSDQGCECDLLVIPLAFQGDREAIYAQPPAPVVLVHDWIWRRRRAGRVVSWTLLKRINLVTR